MRLRKRLLSPSLENGLPFRGRKENKTWNVLASCSFDRLFTFVNVGFEGSAHDIIVWSHSLFEPKFMFPHPPPGITQQFHIHIIHV